MPVPTRRLRLRAASRILANLLPPEGDSLELPSYQWQRLQQLFALADHAKRSGWRYAAQRSRDRLRWPLEELRQSLQAIERELSAPASYRTTLAELDADLAALQDDFDDLRIDLTESTLSVVMEPVVLESVDLGRFEIQLRWNRLRTSSSPYLVRALDGQGAATDSSVSHPHVRDEQLCEGDAYSAIRAALRSGRLLDFFTIVAQTLAAYNGDSAYVRLELWEGVPCGDCGQTITDDDRSCCERCESTLCSDCTSGCSACGTSLCSSCSASCAVCSDAHCPSCLSECACCQSSCCERDLDDDQFCASCREAAEEEAEVDPPEASVPLSPDHSLRLGEAPISP